MDEITPQSVLEELTSALYGIKTLKPNDRSELDRRFAIVITDLEKLLAVYEHTIVEPIENGDYAF